MSKCVHNFNSKGVFHGYQEWYWEVGRLATKCFCNNGVKIDYQEFHYNNSELVKNFYM